MRALVIPSDIYSAGRATWGCDERRGEAHLMSFQFMLVTPIQFYISCPCGRVLMPVKVLHVSNCSFVSHFGEEESINFVLRVDNSCPPQTVTYDIFSGITSWQFSNRNKFALPFLITVEEQAIAPGVSATCLKRAGCVGSPKQCWDYPRYSCLDCWVTVRVSWRA